MKKRLLAFTMASIMVASSLVGCGKKQEAETNTTGKIAGDLTVLTNRTDLVDNRLKDYAAEFNKKYPDVKVKFEALKDYSGEVKIRMNSQNYGDVLLVPNEVAGADLQNFFEPLGKVDELGKKYRSINEKAYDGTVYGIPTFINAQGVLYNKKVFTDAGVTTMPKTPDEFLAALKLVKEKTQATPYYTNYKDGWPLSQWEGNRTAVAGDADFVNKLAHTPEPFAAGQPHYIIYKLMYDIVKNGLAEKDPITSDWEASKQMMADGKIASMVLGSWAISQVKALSKTPDDIAYMPFPVTAPDGKLYAAAGGDWNVGISKYSKNKEAAKAWIDFFLNESGFAEAEGAIPVQVDSKMPAALKAFEDLGVTLIYNNPAKAGEEGLVDKIDSQSEVGLWQDAFKKSMIDSALGNNKQSFEDIAKDLNAKWSAAEKELAQ